MHTELRRFARSWRDEGDDISRELARLESAPRYAPLRTNIFGAEFEIVDGLSFAALYREIFIRRIYAFASETSAPRIIDGGANIGVSALFFKRAHPASRITAFEPDPRLCATMRANLAAAGIADVKLINTALWAHDQGIEFWAEDQSAVERFVPETKSKTRFACRPRGCATIWENPSIF